MIKLMGIVGKKPGWTNEEWYLHYADRHGPLSATVKDFGQYAHKYTQNYSLFLDRTGIPNHAKRFNGVTELWFDDLPALNKAYAEPEYMRVLRTDELRFCSFEDILVAVTREHPILEEAI